ncbi:hypothetical protein [Streptomyces chartreusis]|uniref:hypothetical protein n=1 Tax=Streptomyces chartreusis TaxID=1969 RepID=UPI0037F181A0
MAKLADAYDYVDRHPATVMCAMPGTGWQTGATPSRCVIAPTFTGDRGSAFTLVRVVRTCTAVPSQWNAWTGDGQYLYLRYRSGIGTVDAYDTEDSTQWTRIPNGEIAHFDTGDRLDGEMDLVEFCERAGLHLADDAEVTGE